MDRTSISKREPLDTEVFQEPRQFSRVSSQVFCMDGEWFFETSNENRGPFTRREAAEQALERLTEEANP